MKSAPTVQGHGCQLRPQSNNPRDRSATCWKPLVVREKLIFVSGWWLLLVEISHKEGVAPKTFL